MEEDQEEGDVDFRRFFRNAEENDEDQEGADNDNNNDNDEEDEEEEEEDNDEEEEDDDDEEDEDPVEDDEENENDDDREAIDGGVAGSVLDEQRQKITRSLKCPLVRTQCHFIVHRNAYYIDTPFSIF